MFAASFMVISLVFAQEPAQASQAAQGRGQRPAVSTSAEGAVLEITARLVDANGRIAATATRTGTGSFQGYLSTDQCGLSAGDREPSRAIAGWTFSAQVSDQGADGRVVQLNWRRVWDGQRRISDSTNNNIERTMTFGERVQVDRIDLASGSGSCGTNVQFELALVRPGTTMATFGARGGRVAGVGAAAGARAGATAAAGAAAGAITKSEVAPARGGRGAASGAVAAENSRNFAVRRDARGAQLFSAELWLVHTVPDSTPSHPQSTTGAGGGRGGRGFVRPSVARGSVPSQAGPGEREEVLRQVLVFSPSGSGFVFPAMSVQTSRGPVNVIVMGTVSARLDNGTPKTLIVNVNRQVTSGEGAGSASGVGSTKEIPWPASGDVISFELPPATGQDPLAKEKVSIRLRLGMGGRGAGGIR